MRYKEKSTEYKSHHIHTAQKTERVISNIAGGVGVVFTKYIKVITFMEIEIWFYCLTLSANLIRNTAFETYYIIIIKLSQWKRRFLLKMTDFGRRKKHVKLVWFGTK